MIWWKEMVVDLAIGLGFLGLIFMATAGLGGVCQLLMQDSEKEDESK